MKSKAHPVIASEGMFHIIIALLVGVITTILFGWWSLPVWLFVLFVIQFFRDPPRDITEEAGAVVAPASGQIVAMGEIKNPYLDEEQSMRVSVFMNVFSVHSNLIPVAGMVKKCWYQKGRFLNAVLDKASSENEHNAVWIRTDDERNIVVVQIAGLIARRILCYINRGDRVATGERYGFIRFGSRVDLYMPTDVQLRVNIGDWVSSGNDVIGILPRSAQ